MIHLDYSTFGPHIIKKICLFIQNCKYRPVKCFNTGYWLKTEISSSTTSKTDTLCMLLEISAAFNVFISKTSVIFTYIPFIVLAVVKENVLVIFLDTLLHRLSQEWWIRARVLIECDVQDGKW